MKNILFCSLLCSTLIVLGAAESSRPTVAEIKEPELLKHFDISRFIGVVGQPTMPYQIGFCRSDSFVYTCVVADPKLESYFPVDTAQKIAAYCCQHDTSHMQNTLAVALVNAMKIICKEGITAEALVEGITATKIAVLFVSKPHRMETVCLRSNNSKSIVAQHDMPGLWVAKDYQAYIEFGNAFESQEHIQALIARGEMPKVESLRNKYLESVPHDIAIEVDSPSLQRYFAEIAAYRKAVKAARPIAIEGGKDIPPKRLEEQSDLLCILF